MPHTLSKSDYKIARTCPTKLYYKELRYPTTRDDNPYLKLLADGGYMVEKFAKLRYPDGVAIDYEGAGAQAAAKRTIEILRSSEHVVLFEATLLCGSMLARTDILVKRGAEFDLLEVKAKLWKGSEPSCEPFRGKNGAISAPWKPYLEDVTFQVMLLEELFPNAVVHPFLVMPDKAKTTRIDELYRFFTIRRLTTDGSPIDHIEVDFTGDLNALRRDDYLTTVPTDREVRELMPLVRTTAGEFARSLQPELVKIPTPISVDCKSCEFRGNESDRRDGFMNCWGSLGAIEPHLLDLYKIGSNGGANRAAYRLITAGKVCLLDMDPGALARADGTMGPDAERQRTQLACASTNEEWVSHDLGALLDRLPYPLHFIDFETSRLAIPYHSGMRAYGLVAFQWSCHTLREPNGAVEHTEWLNGENAFPDFEFARSLRDAIGGDGSVLTWATHEGSSLAEIRRIMEERQHVDPDLAAWIDALRTGQPGRIVDMNAITKAHYCHPMMQGSTSIKRVLAAVWATDPLVRHRFPEYGSGRGSPYGALPEIEIGGRPLRVEEGTEAMRAYQDMMYGAGRLDPEVKRRYADLLLQYCRLDTAAMIMIWDHWRRIAPQLR